MGKLLKFKRPFPTRRYRKLFVLATEGSETEPRYFALFNSQTTTVRIKCLITGTDSDPIHVLKRMERHLRDNKLKPGDAAWLVVDTDQWTEEQLTKLHNWSKKREYYGLAVSNPGFEFWVLLHFDDGAGINTLRQCIARQKRYIPNYDKSHIETFRLKPGIPSAIDRARLKDTPACPDWPRSIGTTVYRLVEKLQAG